MNEDDRRAYLRDTMRPPGAPGIRVQCARCSRELHGTLAVLTWGPTPWAKSVTYEITVEPCGCDREEG